MNRLTDDTAELLDSVDLEALWLELVGPQGRNRQWPCPMPSHAQTGRTPPVSLSDVNGRQLWHCHGCGAGGSALDLVVAVQGDTIAEAYEWLRRYTGATERAAQRTRQPHPSGARSKPSPDAGKVTGPEADRVVADYLEARQWPPDVVEAFGLEAVKDRRGLLRIRHPYRSAGTVTWWQDRATQPGQEPKWMSPPEMPRQPYAVDLEATLDLAEVPPPDWDRGVLFVCEGPPDVVSLWATNPATPAVGLPGAEGAQHWAPMFAGLDVLIGFDADPAGDKAAETLARALAQHPGTRTARLRPPEGSDLTEWRRQVRPARFAEALFDALESVEWSES